MRLFCILAFLIAFWFMGALVLYPKYFALFKEMDRNVLFDWLLSGSLFGDPVRPWLAGLIAIVAVLGLNLAACVIDDLIFFFRLAANKSIPRRIAFSKLSLFVVHLSYIVILSGHFTTATTGYRVSMDVSPGKMLAGAPAPFKMRCEKAEVISGMRGRLMASAVITIDPGGENEKTLRIMPGRTTWLNGVMLDMEAKLKKPNRGGAGPLPKLKPSDASPALKMTKNFGLIFDTIGSALFFIGIVLRVIFRK